MFLRLFYFLYLQSYGAEDDKTFGIPGEVTTQHFVFELVILKIKNSDKSCVVWLVGPSNFLANPI